MEEIIHSFGIDWKVMLAAIVNFLVVIWVIYYFLNKKIFSVLDERREKIKEGISRFEESEKHLAVAKEDSSDILKKARTDAEKKIQEARQLAEKTKSDILTNAKESALEERQVILKKADLEKQNIIKTAKDEIAEIAILKAEKILSSK